ncbi:hypothetical protein LIER_29861 [Lithospermum erythrorhizon]|uniref:Uncharacterized protein n=1 Tax=Lithospermum erythrorhizon TaxID=34254 RepID=A0AAV3RLR4_LITER
MVEVVFEIHDDNDDENDIDEYPNVTAEEYYHSLGEANTPLWDGCTTYTKLKLASELVNLKSELVNLKSESVISQSHYKRMLEIMKGISLNGWATIPNDFYEAKKMLAPLYLHKHKIHACVNNCMLYYKETEEIDNCIHFLEPRYKPTYSR